MEHILRFPSAVPKDDRIAAWFAAPDHELRRMTEPWWARMRGCGADVREVLHDNYPTACVDDAPFAYVRAFTAHANVGFFYGVSRRSGRRPGRRRPANAAREAPVGRAGERGRADGPHIDSLSGHPIASPTRGMRAWRQGRGDTIPIPGDRLRQIAPPVSAVTG